MRSWSRFESACPRQEDRSEQFIIYRVLDALTDSFFPALEGIGEQMLRISDLLDSYRDLLASSRDAYLSMVSNRLNSISKQLTIVATIFLPLAFVTGFFGQNFKWMTDHIQSFAAFAILGVGGLVVAAVALLVWFRRGGYL